MQGSGCWGRWATADTMAAPGCGHPLASDSSSAEPGATRRVWLGRQRATLIGSPGLPGYTTLGLCCKWNSGYWKCASLSSAYKSYISRTTAFTIALTGELTCILMFTFYSLCVCHSEYFCIRDRWRANKRENKIREWVVLSAYPKSNFLVFTFRLEKGRNIVTDRRAGEQTKKEEQVFNVQTANKPEKRVEEPLPPDMTKRNLRVSEACRLQPNTPVMRRKQR